MKYLPLSFTSALRRFYDKFLRPTSHDQDIQRREFIFTVLVLGAFLLTFMGFMLMLVHSITQGAAYDGLNPLVLFIPSLVLIGLYVRGRQHFNNALAYIFILLFLGLGTLALYVASFVLSEGLLAYVLVIVMAGILISASAACIMTGIIAVCLIVLSYIQINGITQPNVDGLLKPLSVADIIIFLFIFGVVLLVSWLSNRDIERSLRRARHSEAALRRERNSLEIKVRERTRELEQTQVEKVLQLQRFAEFGQFSSTLLHELANPLTSVSLELEQLESEEQSEIIKQARKGIAHMEEYVDAARRQLRNESEVRVFNSTAEITRILALVEPKASRQHVTIASNLVDEAPIFGDSVRFTQIVSNLIGNAIDAYADDAASSKRLVSVVTSVHDSKLQIEVSDKGAGIKSDDIAKIFEPFYTTKSVKQGIGLGLSITKRAVEEGFSGSIMVSSKKQRGTKFTITIPLHES